MKKDIISIEDFHVDEKDIVSNIRGVVVDETLYEKILFKSENYFVLLFSDAVKEQTGQLIPYGTNDFIFEWNVKGTTIYSDLNEQFTMEVSSKDETLLTGNDEYTLQLTEDNLKLNNDYKSNIFIYLGLLILVIAIFGTIFLVVKKLFMKGE